MLKALFYKTSEKKEVLVSKLQRTFSEALIEDAIETSEAVIRKWIASENANRHDTFYSSSLFSAANRGEARLFVQGVKDLQDMVQFMESVNPRSDNLIRAQDLIDDAIKRLEKEFFWILSSKRDNLHQDSSKPRSLTRAESSLALIVTGSENGGLDADIMSDLKTIADCLIYAGHSEECLRIYRDARKFIIQEELCSLSVEKLSFSQLQRLEPDVLESKIKLWLRAVNIAVSRLFHSEKILCDSVFAAHDGMNASCFAEIIHDGVVTLFAFPEGVSKLRKNPKLMFSILDLYETISVILPEIEFVFCFESTSKIRSHALETLKKLGESVSQMIGDFEMSVQKDVPKTINVSTGAVHPLASQVMDYTAFLANYVGAVTEILFKWPLSPPPPLPETYFKGGDGAAPPSPVTTRLAWQILVLLCKIDGKTESFRDPAMSYLFLAINLHYVNSRVRQSNLRQLLGDDWIGRNEEKLEKYAARYAKLAWGKVIASLPDDPTAAISPDRAKECCEAFNEAFEEAVTKQTGRVVPDPTLAELMKAPLYDQLVSGYRAFYEKNRVGLGDIAKFTPEDIRNYVLSLFSATAAVRANYPDGGNGGEVTYKSQLSRQTTYKSLLSSQATCKSQPSRVARHRRDSM